MTLCLDITFWYST